MKFNLDITEAYLNAFNPIHTEAQSSALHLQTVSLNVPQSHRTQSTLCIVNADRIHTYDADDFQDAYIVIPGVTTPEIQAELTRFLPSCCHTLLLTTPSQELDILEIVLHMIEELTAWSDEFLLCLNQHASLEKIFTCAQRIFSNPLMVSDASMGYVTHIGLAPDSINDVLWTPAIETGFCPIENYYTLWNTSTDDPFGITKAFVVSSDEYAHSYLYRNIAADSTYFGSFELIDVNMPFTRADISYADYIGDILTLVFSSHEHTELTEASSNPLYDMMHNKPVRKELVAFVLKHMGWDMNEPYHVTYFQPSGPLCKTASGRIQCRKRIEAAYPKALIFDEEDGFCAIKRQADFPIESAACTSESVSKLFAPPYEIAMGASSTMTDFSYLPSGLKQARFALSFAKKERLKPHAPVACLVRFDDCYFDAFIQAFVEHDFRALLTVSPVNILITSDQEAQTEYVKTIVSFFENGFNIHHTADALHIHRNTLAYRLKRIKQLSGIDCETPHLSTVDPLRVYIACRAYLSAEHKTIQS